MKACAISKWVAAFLGIVALVITLNPPVSQAAEKPIRIGVLFPLTGPLAPAGQNAKKGIELAQEKINGAGGIMGRKVVLIFEDDKAEPPVAAERAKKLIGQDKVDFVMGTGSSATTNAVIPVTERAKKLFIYTFEGEKKACQRYVFTSGGTPYQALSAFVPYYVKHFGKKWYFVGTDYVFPHSVNAQVKSQLKELGATVVGEEYSPFGTTEWATVITRVEGTKPDVLFLAAPGTEGITFFKQAKNFGLDKKMAITGYPTFLASFYPAFQKDVEGIVSPELYTEMFDHPANKEYSRLYHAKYKSPFPIDSLATSAYIGLHLLKAGVEKAKSIDPKKVKAALEGITINTPVGAMYVRPTDHQPRMRGFITKVVNGKFEIIAKTPQLLDPDTCKGRWGKDKSALK